MATALSLFDRGDDSLIVKLEGPNGITTPSLTSNLISRVVFGILAIILCLVPMKHLYRSGEFAAVVFIANLIVVNSKTVICALIWRNDDTDSWWLGGGLCDLNPYLHNISISLYVTCLLAMMRNLSQQVNLLRANPLTVREKRQRNIIQALIIFPLPLIQVAWIWPLTSQRYAVGTLIGCVWLAWPSWPYLVFFIAAPVFIAILTAGYAILVFVRFREVAKTTRSVLSSNRLANMRAQRTKRRLYLMVISIIIPFLPIIIFLAVLNVQHASPLMPFDYDQIHNHDLPYPWDSIIYIPSNQQDWILLNNCYSPILSAIPIFVFFGMTKNAINDYRRGCLAIGLGRVFPGLHEEYDPDRDAYGSSALSSRATASTNSTTKKIRSILSNRRTITSSPDDPPEHAPIRSSSATKSSVDVEQGYSPTGVAPPQPVYSQASHDSNITTSVRLPQRNPFLFRTQINVPSPFNILGSFLSKGHPNNPSLNLSTPLESLSIAQQPHWDHMYDQSGIQTRVWSSEKGHTNRAANPNVRCSDLSSPPRGVSVETELTRKTHQR